MSVILTKKQLGVFEVALKEQEDAASEPTVCLVGDSPNLTRTVEGVYGKGARPDLAAVLSIAREPLHRWLIS
jgi:hypothetical protein